MPDDVEAYQRRLAQVLMPSALSEHQRIAQQGVRFVHYTRAETALEILRSKCIWMRNASCMNDYNEMRHGLGCLIGAFSKEIGAAFNGALEGCHPGLAADLDKRFTEAAPHLLEHTYLTCVSEHSDDEETYGRLSMWQTYAASTGAALVFNNKPFLSESSALQLYFLPVNYVNADGFAGQIQSIADNLTNEREAVAGLPKEEVFDAVFRALVFTVVSTKHEGFKDEREWRIVHLPMLWPETDDRVLLDQTSFNGVPQPIFKIPFKDYPDEGFSGATIPDLIDRVIIGPTQYPAAVRTAFAQVLTKAEMAQAQDRVHCSNLTLRMNG